MVRDQCERCRELVSLRLDTPQSEFEEALVERHLASCAACRRFAADVTASTALLRRAEYVPLPGPIRIDLPSRRVRPRVLAVGSATAAAAAAAAAVLAFAVHGLTGVPFPSGATLSAQGSADLASMRLSRRQVLRPPAVGLDQLRVRVVVVD